MSGNNEYSECLCEFLLGKVQKKALANKQAACNKSSNSQDELILQPLQCKFRERFPNAKTNEWQTALYIRVVRHHANTVSVFRCPNL